VKFLIDECLSSELARLARGRGHPQSTHVTWLGLAGRKDWVIARRAADDGYVLVTNNTGISGHSTGGRPFHVGLVCLNVAPGLMSLELQNEKSTTWTRCAVNCAPSSMAAPAAPSVIAAFSRRCRRDRP
jgi:predicted nuclease of predicted toxin-antitoxin system